jgi:hypothetical protein
VHPPSEVYRGDDYVYWGFGAGGLSALATHAGFSRVTIDATPTIDGHPRILATGPAPDQAASKGAAVRTRAKRQGGRSSPHPGTDPTMRSSSARSLSVPVVTLNMPARSAATITARARERPG